MGMLRVQKTPFELEREQLLRKAFAASNRKLKNMVESGANPEYVLKVATESFKMQASDMDESVVEYIKHLMKSEEAPAAAAEQPKPKKQKAEKKVEQEEQASEDSSAE